MLRNWFIGDASLEMRRQNVLEFLLWSTFNKRVQDASAAEHSTAETLIDRFEAATGHALLTGYEARLRVMSYTLEAWPECRKPLFVYIIIQMARQVFHFFLRCIGFEYQKAGRLHFWCRPSPPPLLRPAPPPPPPIVLMHGVLGLLPYAMLLRELASHHEGAVLAPIFPHCSITLEHICATLRGQALPHNAGELTAAVRTMIAKHAPPRSPPRAAFIAHSLGSGFLAPILRRAPELVVATAFVDPICFMLPDGHVLKNFLYAAPPLGGIQPASWFHFFQRYLVANEPTVQDCFRNCFWWAQAWLHPSDLPCDTLVVLSGQDSVASASEVQSYLRSWQRRARDWADRARSRPRKLEVQMHEQWAHGWLLLHPKEQRALVKKVIRMTLLNAYNQPYDEAAAAKTSALSHSPGAVHAPYEHLQTPLAPETPTVDELRYYAADVQRLQQRRQRRSGDALPTRLDDADGQLRSLRLCAQERYLRPSEESMGDTASQASVTSSEDASANSLLPCPAGM